MNLQIDDILFDPPLVHGGGTYVWGLGEDVLRYINDALKPGSKTLETGAGVSTILFAARSSEHTCITPIKNEIDVIRSYCLRKNISLDHVNFIIGYSQDVLPTLNREYIDLVLIDGGHGYPIPAIDWFYTAQMLKIGGVVVIDDVHLWTGLELKRFLAKEHAWNLVRNFGKSSAYTKVEEEYALEWIFQPYIVSKSRLPMMLSRMQRAFGLLLSGKFSKLFNTILKQLEIG